MIITPTDAALGKFVLCIHKLPAGLGGGFIKGHLAGPIADAQSHCDEAIQIRDDAVAQQVDHVFQAYLKANPDAPMELRREVKAAFAWSVENFSVKGMTIEVHPTIGAALLALRAYYPDNFDEGYLRHMQEYMEGVVAEADGKAVNFNLAPSGTEQTQQPNIITPVGFKPKKMDRGQAPSTDNPYEDLTD